MTIQQISVIDNWDFEGELYELVETPTENEEDEETSLLIILIDEVAESGIPFIINEGDSFNKEDDSAFSIYIKIPFPPPELT